MGAKSSTPSAFLFKNCDREFLLSQVQRTGKSCGASTDNGNALALGWDDKGFWFAVFRIPNAGSLKLAESYGFVTGKCALAAGLAGAITEDADDGREDGGVTESLVSLQPSPFGRFFEKSPDIHMKGTGAGTGGELTAKAICGKTSGVLKLHASSSLLLGAEGAHGAIARGEAPQRGAQPRERRMPAKQAPRGAADSLLKCVDAIMFFSVLSHCFIDRTPLAGMRVKLSAKGAEQQSPG
jgi:hypothetical protein